MPETIRSLSLSSMIAPAICSRATRLLGTGNALSELTARKIPLLSSVLLLGQLLFAAETTVAAQSADTARLFRDARASAQAYEFAIRRHAPLLFSGSRPTQCDEWVGRFCIIFDTGRDSLPAEPNGVRTARDTAIARLERAASHAPGRDDIVFSLIRYLIQARKHEAALTVARTYADARGADSIGD